MRDQFEPKVPKFLFSEFSETKKPLDRPLQWLYVRRDSPPCSFPAALMCERAAPGTRGASSLPEWRPPDVERRQRWTAINRKCQRAGKLLAAGPRIVSVAHGALPHAAGRRLAARWGHNGAVSKKSLVGACGRTLKKFEWHEKEERLRRWIGQKKEKAPPGVVWSEASSRRVEPSWKTTTFNNERRDAVFTASQNLAAVRRRSRRSHEEERSGRSAGTAQEIQPTHLTVLISEIYWWTSEVVPEVLEGNALFYFQLSDRDSLSLV